MSAAELLVVFVVLFVVVLVCPSLLFVVVAVYPPVILVFDPDVFVCVLVSFANDTVLTPSIKVRINISNMLFFISPPEEIYADVLLKPCIG